MQKHQKVCQYCRYESALNDNSVFVHSDGNNNTDSFHFFKKITGRAGSNCAENVEVMVNWNI